jgi:hypothetical protein
MPIATRIQDELRQQPETGMGWQLVEVRRRYETVATEAVVRTPGATGDRVREGFAVNQVRRAEELLESGSSLAALRVLTRAQAVTEGVIPRSFAILAQSPAADAPTEWSDTGERFLRFSAFARDHRILPDGSVTAGTYVTTYADGLKVTTGSQAVARYALPNPDPAVHRFHLRPPEEILVRRGIVQPAFGQPGGGVEVIFENGAPARTLYHYDTIPAR